MRNIHRSAGGVGRRVSSHTIAAAMRMPMFTALWSTAAAMDATLRPRLGEQRRADGPLATDAECRDERSTMNCCR